jgi:hypothetical protein
MVARSASEECPPANAPIVDEILAEVFPGEYSMGSFKRGAIRTLYVSCSYAIVITFGAK